MNSLNVMKPFHFFTLGRVILSSAARAATFVNFSTGSYSTAFNPASSNPEVAGRVKWLDLVSKDANTTAV